MHRFTKLLNQWNQLSFRTKMIAGIAGIVVVAAVVVTVILTTGSHGAKSTPSAASSRTSGNRYSSRAYGGVSSDLGSTPTASSSVSSAADSKASATAKTSSGAQTNTSKPAAAPSTASTAFTGKTVQLHQVINDGNLMLEFQTAVISGKKIRLTITATNESTSNAYGMDIKGFSMLDSKRRPLTVALPDNLTRYNIAKNGSSPVMLWITGDDASDLSEIYFTYDFKNYLNDRSTPNPKTVGLALQ